MSPLPSGVMGLRVVGLLVMRLRIERLWLRNGTPRSETVEMKLEK